MFKRLRKKLIWIGGWEKANGQGWEFRYDCLRGKKWLGPTPIALFGHCIVINRWGITVSLINNYFVWCWKDGTAYLSPNGTPSQAVKWLMGREA